MNASKVYCTNLRVRTGDTLQMKLERLLRKAGLPTMDLEDKYVAVRFISESPATWPISAPTTPALWWTW